MKKQLFLFCFLASMSNAQYFNSNAFQFTLGWMGQDTTGSIFRPSPDPSPWPTTDLLQIGIGYQYALVGYELWWLTQTAFSLGYTRNYNLSDSQILSGMTGFTGLRYNFASLAWRPFIWGGLGLLALFTDPNSANTTSGGKTTARTWMTLQLGPGIEWIFTDQMSIQLDAGAILFTDLQREPRFSYIAKLSYLFYF